MSRLAYDTFRASYMLYLIYHKDHYHYRYATLLFPFLPDHAYNNILLPYDEYGNNYDHRIDEGSRL